MLPRSRGSSLSNDRIGVIGVTGLADWRLPHREELLAEVQQTPLLGAESPHSHPFGRRDQ